MSSVLCLPFLLALQEMDLSYSYQEDVLHAAARRKLESEIKKCTSYNVPQQSSCKVLCSVQPTVNFNKKHI